MVAKEKPAGKRTTIQVEYADLSRLDRLVGRFGRTKREVVLAGISKLEDELRATAPGAA